MNNIEHKFIIDRKKGRMLLENANIVLGALIDKTKNYMMVLWQSMMTCVNMQKE